MRITLTQDEIEKITAFLCDGSIPERLNAEQKKTFKDKAGRFSLDGPSLLIKDTKTNLWLRAVPDDDLEQIREIVRALHLPNHIGMTKMYHAVSRLYAGFKRTHIDDFIRTCEACQRHQPLKRIAQIQPIISDYPWERLQIDCIDLRKHSDENYGFNWILNIVDTYSKFLYAFPMVDKRASTVHEHLEYLFKRESLPVELQSDNGTEFVNSDIRSLCAAFNIRHIRGRPRHPQSQGQIERANQTIVRAISKALYEREQKCWVDILDDIIYKYNITQHRATGQSSMRLLRRREGTNFSNTVSITDTIPVADPEAADDQTSVAYDLGAPLPPSPVCEFGEASITALNPQEDIQFVESHEVLEHRLNYFSGMQNDADVHFHRATFFNGNQVLLKKDFDANPETRREKLGDFYEAGVWTVDAKVGNSYRVTLNGESKTVSKSRIKKYIS